MERSDWLKEKLGDGQNHPLPKSGKGFVWADKTRCDWSDKNDVIDASIYNGVRRFSKNRDETMERDKYVTLISHTHNNNFGISFVNYLTLGDDWQVALV